MVSCFCMHLFEGSSGPLGLLAVVTPSNGRDHRASQMCPVPWVKWGGVLHGVVASFNCSQNCDYSCIEGVQGNINANRVSIKGKWPFIIIAEGVSEVLKYF